MNFCTKCGNQLKPNARFCGKCGEAFKVAEPQPQQINNNVARCISCGAAITPGFKFCTVCGATVGVAVPFSEEPKPYVPPLTPKKPIPVVAQPKKRRKSGIILIFSIVFLILLSAGGWWYFYGFGPSIEEDIVRPEYTSHPLVNGTTTSESTEADAKPGEILNIKLADSSGISIFGLKDNAHVSLKKESNDLQALFTGIETSGYKLSLTIQGSDSISMAQPVITFNRSQVGDINPATINIVRVSDKLDTAGNIIKDQYDFLPVSLDKSGNYVAVDYLFPVTAFRPVETTVSNGGFIRQVSQLFIPEARAQQGGYLKGMECIANVDYTIITFQGKVNWTRNPILVQMTPDARKPYSRRPATKKEFEERKSPVTNIIVLVHGHNEEEKGGYEPDPKKGVMKSIDDAYKYLGWDQYDNTQTNGIWQYSYKRDVWNYMYQYYVDEQKKAAAADVNKPDSCTLFYEFIYPSYRPIYTPVPHNSIYAHQTLGAALGEALNKELLEKNPMVAEMVKKNLPFNIFFVGHSMGGLVARAGLRSLNVKLQNNVKRLITWGTPHQGSPLTTLRYITAAGFDVSIDGLPFYPYGKGPAAVMELMAMDTPGTRDLRWSNGSKGFEKFFNYDTYFKGNSKTDPLDPQEYDLRTGTMFYNQNLTTFNDNEKFADRFTFLTGSTSKIAQVKKCSFLFTKAYYLLVKASDCAKGSYIINLMAGDDSYKANDGASPVYGQGGFGLWPRPRAVDLGDIDHEEFYGGQGWETAARTFWEMNKSAECGCPYIDSYTIDKENISAKLIWPKDPNPGNRIKRIDAMVTDIKTKEVIASSNNFKFKDPKGVFTGTISVGKKHSNKELQLLLRVTTREESNVDYKTDISVTADMGSVCGVYEGTFDIKVNEANVKEYYLSKAPKPPKDEVLIESDAALYQMDLDMAKEDAQRALDNFNATKNGKGGGPTIRFEIAPTKGMENYYETKGLAYTVYRGRCNAYITNLLTPLKDKSNIGTTLKCSSSGFTAVTVEDNITCTVHGKFQGENLVGDWSASCNGKVLHSATFKAKKIDDWIVPE
jgi:triacylglycerol esterase/lipase EstA (alpha/beta hydrolase family)